MPSEFLDFIAFHIALLQFFSFCNSAIQTIMRYANEQGHRPADAGAALFTYMPYSVFMYFIRLRQNAPSATPVRMTSQPVTDWVILF